MDLVLLTINDAVDLIRLTQLQDLLTPVFALFWLILLLMPLTGIDRRDGITFLTYAVFMLAAGVTLFLAIPHALVEESFATFKHFILILALLPMITARWVATKGILKYGKR